MKLPRVLAFAAASFVAVSANAVTMVYTDRAVFTSALSTSQVTPFAAPAGSFTFVGATYNGTGFTIGNSSANGYQVDGAYSGIYQWNSGPVYDAERGVLTFFVDTELRAFGFDYGNPTGGANSASNTITIDGIARSEYSQPAFAFYGVISDGAISPITVDFNGGVGIVDYVTTGTLAAGAVPEPATWGLMVLGFGGVGYAMRRNRKVAVSVQ